MFRYLVRRLLWALVLFFATTLVTYVIFYAIPVDPARTVCGQRATPECVHRAEAFLGTNRPVYYQYYKFVYRMMPFSFAGGFHFHEPSLGRSFTNRLSVNYVVGQAAPVTASLVLGGVVIWLLVGLSIGIFSALRPRSLLDRGGMTFVLIGISAHPVWIGLLLAEQNVEEYVPLPAATKGDFLLRVKGESMIDAGILDGDLVIVQRAQDARNGEIVVALAGDDESADEATVKTFYREQGRVRLQPENSSMEPIYARHVQILGRVVGVFREL